MASPRRLATIQSLIIAADDLSHSCAPALSAVAAATPTYRRWDLPDERARSYMNSSLRRDTTLGGVPMLTFALSTLGTLEVVMLLLNFRKPERSSAQSQTPQRYQESTAQARNGHASRARDRTNEFRAGAREWRRGFSVDAPCHQCGETHDNLRDLHLLVRHVGERFAEALMERAQAGVLIHIMLDGVGCSKMPPD